jgi:hypothetical protein
VGTAGKDDGVFQRALSYAVADGFVKRSGFFKYAVTEQGDGILVDAEHIVDLERELVSYLTEVGLADAEAIAMRLGAETPTAPEFRAALERALASEEIEWVDASTYGLPAARLTDFEPPPELEQPEVPNTSTKSRPVKQVAPDLSKAVLALSVAMLGAGKPAPTKESTNAKRTSDAYQELKKLGELRDAGVLTPEEFDEKKALLLLRIA